MARGPLQIPEIDGESPKKKFEVAIINEPGRSLSDRSDFMCFMESIGGGQICQISHASFVRYLEDNSSADGGLLLIAVTSDGTELYFHAQLVIVKAVATEPVISKRAGLRALTVHQATCGVCAQAAHAAAAGPHSPAPSPRAGHHGPRGDACEKQAYRGLILKRKADLVLFVQVTEETAAHSPDPNNAVQFRLQISLLNSAAASAKLSSPFTVYDRLPRHQVRPRIDDKRRTARYVVMLLGLLKAMAKAVEKGDKGASKKKSGLLAASTASSADQVGELLAKIEGIVAANQTASSRSTTRRASWVQKGGLTLTDDEQSAVMSFVQYIAKRKPGVLHTRSYSGRAILHFAALLGYELLSSWLLETQQDLVKAADVNGVTALHIAVEERLRDLCHLLLQKGAVASQPDERGESALDYANREQSADLLELPRSAPAAALVADSLSSAASAPESIAIHDAAFNNDVAGVTKLLQEGVNHSAIDADRATPLFAAAAGGALEVAQLLCERGAQHAHRDCHGATALHVGALHGQDALVKFLLAQGADCNAEDSTGNTPFHSATYGGSAVVLEALVRAGADVNKRIRNTGATPLHVALFKNRTEAAEYLLTVAAIDVNALDADKVSPLHHAAFQGNVELCRALLAKRANVNAVDAKGYAPLHCACVSGNLEIVSLLLEHGAEIPTTDKPTTPLHCASFHGHAPCLSALLDGKKAAVNVRDADKCTALHKAAFKGHEECINVLLEAGADVAAKDSEGNSALHLSCFAGHLNAVRALVTAKAPLESKDSEESTPLHQACFYGHKVVAEALVAAGAQVNAVDATGATPLLLACGQGASSIVSLLLKREASVNAFDKKGKSALHHAINHVDCMVQLIERGALVDLADSEGKTPLFHSVQYGLEDAIRLLLMRGANIQVRAMDGKTIQEIAAETNHYQVLLKAMKMPTPSKPHSPTTASASPAPGGSPPTPGAAATAAVPATSAAAAAAAAADPAAEQKALFDAAAKKFNVSPNKGVDHLISSGVSAAKDVARFLLTTDSLKKDKIGDWLGDKNDFNLAVLQQFIESLDFKGMDFDQSLRLFLSKLRLPGEAQKIDRMMERFANRYCSQNPDVFLNQDAAYLLAFSLIMLNTDAHNPAIKNKMTKAQFIRNSQFNEETSLPAELLERFYNSILQNPLKMDDENSMFASSEKKGFLTKQGGRVKTWKRRWFVLSNNCLYYFKKKEDEDKDKPCGYIPLENLDVKDLPKGVSGRKHCFMLFDPHADQLKACKIGDGSFEKGHHESYIISAENAQELMEWIEALRKNMIESPYKQLMELAKKQKAAKAPGKKVAALPSSPASAPPGASPSSSPRKPRDVDMSTVHNLSALCSMSYRNQKSIKETYSTAVVEAPKHNINCFHIVDAAQKVAKVVLSGTWPTSLHLRNSLNNKKQPNMRAAHMIDETAKHFLAVVQRHMKKDFSIIVAGHTLGGCVAVLIGNVLAQEGFNVSVYTFGQPRFLRSEELEAYRSLPLIRTVAVADPIPFLWPGYYHTGDELVLLKDKFYSVQVTPTGMVEDLKVPDVEKRYPANHVDEYSRLVETKFGGQAVDPKDRANFV